MFERIVHFPTRYVNEKLAKQFIRYIKKPSQYAIITGDARFFSILRIRRPSNGNDKMYARNTSTSPLKNTKNTPVNSNIIRGR